MVRDEEFPSRTFLLYWRATVVSAFGTYITLLALQTLVVLTLHGSATDVGWLNSARWLPYLVVGIVVGAVVDRRPRRPILIATDLVQAGLLATIPLLWWVDRLSMPTVLVVVMAYGTASVVNGAAAMSFLPRLVPSRHLQRAHARGDGADAAAMSAGPALGGLLVGALGAPLAVLVDAATYLYSALTLSRIDVTEPPPKGGATAKALVFEIREGIRWVYRGSGLITLALATHAWFVGNAVVGVVLAPYALGELGLTPAQFGIIGALGGLGALVGAAITTRVGLWLGTGRTVIACHLITTGGCARDGGSRRPLPRLGLGHGARRRPGALRSRDGDEQLARDELPTARHARRAPGPHQHLAPVPQPCRHGHCGTAGRDPRRRLGDPTHPARGSRGVRAGGARTCGHVVPHGARARMRPAPAWYGGLPGSTPTGRLRR